MGRNVFLSFLGTGRYIPCRYHSSELGESDVVLYVQEAICQLACSDFGKKDKAFIFLTGNACSTHWSSLSNALERRGITAEPVYDVPEIYSENDIWRIFELVMEKIQPEDRIFLDITHGFRIFPMLAMVLLSYAKEVRGVEVKAIYYGAFEALGKPGEIESNFPDPSHRRAPLLDLKPFSVLQDWTSASAMFLETGNPEKIEKYIKTETKNIRVLTEGKDEIAASIIKLVTGITRSHKEIITNRGGLISRGNYLSEARKELDKLTGTDKPIFAPFRHLLERISEKIRHFGNGASENRMASIKWCRNHGLVQQGITQLQEAVITRICEKHGLDIGNHSEREAVSTAFNRIEIMNRGKERTDKKDLDKQKDKKDQEEIVNKLITDPFIQKYSSSFISLSNIRNDINHGGYRIQANSDPRSFFSKFDDLSNTFINALTAEDEETPPIRKNLLLNLSNHPSGSWQLEQLSAADLHFGDVVDMDFPNILPDADDAYLEKTVETYLKKIEAINPSAIHLMGELTFTYRLVNCLKQLGYRCVASTTSRIVELDNSGNKTSRFGFVRFRDY
jgi:CRISPR-associated DxTHG motif protein